MRAHSKSLLIVVASALTLSIIPVTVEAQNRRRAVCHGRLGRGWN